VTCSPRIWSERFAFRIMKEVRAFVLNGGGTDEEAIDGLIIALAKMMNTSERDLRRRLNR
jgi:hypothetical protein